MARVTARAAFNIDSFNLYRPSDQRWSAFFNDFNWGVNGSRYRDVYEVQPVKDGPYTYLAGASILWRGAPSNGDVTGGLANAIAEKFEGGALRFAIQDISVSAKAVYDAMQTRSRGDELALIRSALSGSDTFELSNSGDRADGYAGNDTMFGFGGNDVLRGSRGGDRLFGGTGRDTLDGGTGRDHLEGGAGSDTYVVQAGDTVVERSGGGSADLVRSSSSWMLGVEFEHLTLTGSSHLQGTGNALGNRITGNGGSNTLSGLAGADTLRGGSGNDRLDGGADSDRLEGGTGNDTYVLSDSGDTIVELARGGTDLVRAALSHTLAAQVERLLLTGTEAINGSGNSLDNRLTGNTAANILRGGNGSDVLFGGEGDDQLYAGSGADRLDGGLGQDRLFGGNDSIGDDFVFTDPSHSVVGSAHDSVEDFTHRIDNIDLRAMDAQPSSDADDGFLWGGKTAAAHSVWWEATSEGVLVRADTTGDASADFEVLLRDATIFGIRDVLL